MSNQNTVDSRINRDKVQGIADAVFLGLVRPSDRAYSLPPHEAMLQLARCATLLCAA